MIAGDTFTISDGTTQLTFEMDDVNDGKSVAAGNIAVPFNTAAVDGNGSRRSETAEEIAGRVREIINSPVVQSQLKLSANLLNNDRTSATSSTVVLVGQPTVNVPTTIGTTIVSQGVGTCNELHYVAERPVDVLAANVKPAVATGLGYTDRSPRLRVEKFMRDYYTHARNLYLITRTLEQRLALVPAPERGLRRFFGRSAVAPAAASEVDGFRIVGPQLVASSRNVLREDPHRLMRAFLHAQQRGLTLHPDLAQLMRQSVTAGLVDRAFLLNGKVRDTFLEILNARGNVAPTVRARHEVGFLGRYLPEFGKLTNLVQHEFYHQYAVDEHTLICVAKLDQVWEAAAPPFSLYSAIFQALERPHVLYLALLLHDSGKAFPGERHELVGGRLALRAAARLRLAEPTTRMLRLLIEQHLTMVQVSQRRDLEDPAVIHQFATQVQSQENLDLLALHTFADSMGTSDTLWNGFKDSLLWQLWRKTREALRGDSEFIRAEQKQRELLRGEVRAILPKTFSEEELDAHFTGLPPRYFQIHPAKAIARDQIGRAHV